MADAIESGDSIKETIVECLSEQLSELELLQSMYPKNEEIILSDNSVIKDITEFIENKSDYAPNHLDYVINITVGDLKLEIYINLPTLYPKDEPDIFVRCNQLNRQQETAMNTELTEYIKNNHSGEVFIYTAISWLQDNIDSFNNMINDDTSQENEEMPQHIEDKFVRLWIYSHHIYNKRKREDIVKKAKELKLTGICLPGKPGLICIEGQDSICKEWWKDIKSMSWKRIVIRKTEIFETADRKLHQKFTNFEEVVFKNPVSKTNKHSDMGIFYKYLEDRGLGQGFNEVFGFNNVM